MKSIRRKYKADTGNKANIEDFDSLDNLNMDTKLFFVNVSIKSKFVNKFLVSKEYLHWLEEKANLKI